MDTTKVSNIAVNAAQAGMEKTGPEFYAFMAVCLILGLVGLVLWFQSKQELKKARALNEVTLAPAIPQAPVPVPVTFDKAALKEILQPIVDNLELRINLQLDGLERVVKENQIREEGRLAVMERKMDDGFRTLHDRLDRHIEADRPQPKGRG
jgi:hypothetical protein